MPNFSTTYANTCGVKLPEKSPDFPSSFIVLPDQKYITLHCGAGHPARIYDYYSEVCSFLAGPLKKHNIVIVQIGGEEEKLSEFCIDYRGKTTLKQCSFLIENALLHFGNDSCWAHLAGIKGIPLINLCPNAPPSVVSPHYHGKLFSFESDKEGKWSYNPNEIPKTINTIKPEKIAAKVLEFLGIESNISIETLEIGKFFSAGRVIDFIPNFPIKPNILKGTLNCRADIEFNQDAIAQFFEFYEGILILDSELNLNVINHYKNKIKKVVYKLDKGYNVEYIEQLTKLGIDYLLSYCGDEAGLSKARLDFFDLDPVWKQSKISKPKIDITENTFFKTKRTLISDFKQYASKAHYRDKKNFNGESLRVGEYLNDDLFWENKEHFYIFNNENNGQKTEK